MRSFVSPEDRTVTEVDGRQLVLSNLSKVLYPDAGFTKAEVISYYVQVAAVLLPHLRGRPMTFTRWPDGVGGPSFYEKNLPAGAPGWVRAIEVPRSSRSGTPSTIRSAAIDDLPTLVWAANQAALELHAPLWRSDVPQRYGPFDQMVFDLDPGAPADLATCCQVAAWVVDALHASGHANIGSSGHANAQHAGCVGSPAEVAVKTSGSKGLQCYVALDPPRPWEAVRDEAHALARAVESQHRDVVVSNMRKDLRPGKVLIDWSQNHPAKTTVAPYSLRARPWPTVSTPVTLHEVAACAESGEAGRLRFVAGDVLRRVEQHGDLFAAALGPAGHSTGEPHAEA